MNNSIAVRRTYKDLKVLENDNLEEFGIYYKINDNNLFRIKCMIIGPENTPYEFGFYFFDIFIPNEYPFKPPKVIFQNRNHKFRFNPNLYVDGKVCISILNTWSGPQWTSCQSLKSILISLQSLLCQNPLHNEPGFENDFSYRNKIYNNLVTHENYNFSIYKLLENHPENFEDFKDIMKNIFLKNYGKIKSRLDQLEKEKYNNKRVHSQIYNMEVKCNYEKIKNNLEELYTSFIGVKAIINKKSLLTVNNKRRKFVPNQRACSFEVGYKCLSENNNCYYVVSLNIKQRKYWKRLSSK